MQENWSGCKPKGLWASIKNSSFYSPSFFPVCFLAPTQMCSSWSPESIVTRADAKKNNSSKNMLMMLSTLPVLQFHSIICTFSPDFPDFRTLFIKCSIINQAPSLTVLMRHYLQHPSPKLLSTPNSPIYYIKLPFPFPSYSGLGAFEMILTRSAAPDSFKDN